MTLSFASVSFLSTFAATVFWGLSLLCFLFSRSALKEFKQSSLFKPVMSIALFEIAHSIYISHQGNQEFFTIFSRYDNWVQLVLFIPMAYFIKHTQCQKLFTLLAFSSFMLAFLMNSDTHLLILMRLSERSGFGWPAIGFGLYASIMLLGLLCFFSNLQNYFSSWPNHKKKLAWCTYGLANVLLILGLIQCQSRGAYLALLQDL